MIESSAKHFLDFRENPNIAQEKSRSKAFFRFAKFSSATLFLFLLFTIGLPSEAHSQKNLLRQDKKQDKVVALTFDDGPDPIITPRVLEILKEKQIKATFFLIGRKIGANPGLVREMVKEGHVIGNHSYSHKWYSGLEDQREIKKDFLLAEQTIEKTTGKKLRFLRSAHGLVSLWFLKEIKNYGFQYVGWDLAVGDWKSETKSEQIVKGIKKRINPGAIILLHDGLDNNIGTQVEVVKALPGIISELEEEGYTFVTVDKILKIEPYFEK